MPSRYPIFPLPSNFKRNTQKHLKVKFLPSTNPQSPSQFAHNFFRTHRYAAALLANRAKITSDGEEKQKSFRSLSRFLTN